MLHRPSAGRRVLCSDATAAPLVEASHSGTSHRSNGTSYQGKGRLGPGYQLPPPEIAEIVDAPSQPSLSFSPDRTKVLQMYRPPPNPPISELARPELKLAGLRLDASMWSRSRMGYYTGLALVDMTDDLLVPAPSEKETRITGYPEGSWLNYVVWSDDSRHLAFTIRSPDPGAREPLEMWVADVQTGQARPLLQGADASLQSNRLNSIFEDFTWIDKDLIAATFIPEDRGEPPAKPLVPIGPRVEDNSEGKTAAGRTYTDLLKNEYDADLLEYYSTSQLGLIQVETGEVERIGPPRMYSAVSPSPDAQWMLVSWMERPFSFNVPCGRFPLRVQLWTRTGAFVREVAYLPLAEDIPIAFNSCRKGPRSLGWRDDRPAELTWIECQDGGDPGVDVSPRDIIFTLPAAAAAEGAAPSQFATTDLRAGGVAWGTDDLALVYQSWWKTRQSIISTIRPGRPEEGLKVLFDRNFEDAYGDPGSPATRRTSMGTYVLAVLEGSRKLLMQGLGASTEGNKPFLDILDVDSGETERLWQSSPPHFEYTGSLLCDLHDKPIRLDTLSLLKSRETPLDPPQFYIQSWDAPGQPPKERQLSQFPHPYPSVRDHQKEILRYKRADGIDLTATLYLPPKYNQERDGPLPCILWAYPREFKSKDAAGQLRKSPYQFTGIGPTSPLLWLAKGWAVLEGPAMPIVAEGDEEPNDTYLQQLGDSARAAVEEVKRRGVADPNRIAVGGHSYGAFMAANLLAHAPDLFACGIARSGAYNRTLTPFGFQAEERTLWEATETYINMSPYLQAHKIQKPLLLIHGEDDNNAGTHTMQSERFYAALKGHGAPCRMVLLPHESHGYTARESVMHMLAEQDAWMEKYCPAPSPASAPSDDGSSPHSNGSPSNGSGPAATAAAAGEVRSRL
ncbi:hypothetical protein WJX74_001254 [Apatococcus lobatus]|uniref:Probable glutamyl endopeptidase, chloroplastic n=1 Tax=Apatococcus lobatus TaxID=904363 RepID=A0AAW1Q2I1_9CHLO